MNYEWGGSPAVGPKVVDSRGQAELSNCKTNHACNRDKVR